MARRAKSTEVTPERSKRIDSNEIREIIFTEALTRLYVYIVYDGDRTVLDDTFQSLMFLGPSGVGKSMLQRLAAIDIARYLSEVRKRQIEVKTISMRISNEQAERVAKEVVEGRVIPYVHLYLPQTKIWHLEGTPSPADSYIEVLGVKIPANLWRMDAYLIPLLDYTDMIKDVNKIVPAILVLDEFNMAREEVLTSLFQLARSAELGRAKLSPFTIISLLGNTPDVNIYAVRQLAAPLVDRAQNYIVSKPSVSGWLAYMNEVYGSKWAQEIGAYLTLNEGELYKQDESDPTVIQTPRGWTQIAIRIHVLKHMVSQGVITREKYWKRVEELLYSTLINTTAAEVYGFLRGIHAVNIKDILENPEKIAMFDKSVAAYVLVKITGMFSRRYVWASEQEKEDMLNKLVELYKYSSKVLGNEALSLIFSSLPMPMSMALAKRMPDDVVKNVREARRIAEQLEEVLTS